ncbi:Calcium/calmodulin dependent protein kinase II association-domain protein [Gorgonomyces haynaldii]|nr:Calcium/calmodulin dependent protein kinase II association-domain protein [Gorgonomyces haynaldii]
MPPISGLEDSILKLNQQLLDSIAQQNWPEYTRLCAQDLVCVEPESNNQFVQGLEFHKYYFGTPDNVQVTMSLPHVRLLNDAAIVSYVRVTQTPSGTLTWPETRVWQRIQGEWKHVHFHKSKL